MIWILKSFHNKKTGFRSDESRITPLGSIVGAHVLKSISLCIFEWYNGLILCAHPSVRWFSLWIVKLLLYQMIISEVHELVYHSSVVFLVI